MTCGRRGICLGQKVCRWLQPPALSQAPPRTSYSISKKTSQPGHPNKQKNTCMFLLHILLHVLLQPLPNIPRCSSMSTEILYIGSRSGRTGDTSILSRFRVLWDFDIHRLGRATRKKEEKPVLNGMNLRHVQHPNAHLTRRPERTHLCRFGGSWPEKGWKHSASQGLWCKSPVSQCQNGEAKGERQMLLNTQQLARPAQPQLFSTFSSLGLPPAHPIRGTQRKPSERPRPGLPVTEERPRPGSTCPR